MKLSSFEEGKPWFGRTLDSEHAEARHLMNTPRTLFGPSLTLLHTMEPETLLEELYAPDQVG